VRCPDRWLSKPIHDALFEVLRYATQDQWEIAFNQRVTPGRSSETQCQLRLGHPEEPCEVALYSGGLDSFAGLAAAVSQRPHHRFICVSVTGNQRHLQRQNEQLGSLQRTLGVNVTHVPVQYHLVNAEQQRQERTRRTRGILFLLVGGITALIAGKSELLIFENGVGAINLPQDGAQIGIDNSRSVNPVALVLVGRLLSLISGEPFTITNECIFKTKAEMCAHPTVAKVSGGIRSTFSCDGFPVRRRHFAQCGFCTSCLLRRQALEAALMQLQDSDDYGCDLTQDGPFLSHHLHGLRAMSLQAHSIDEAMKCADQWRGMTLVFPELRRAADALSHNNEPALVKHALLGMYKRHAEEWRAFSALQRLAFQPLQCVA
jgi:7-cyano-7-deazaguanine synthase in queuosine biosynthesis